MLENCEIVTVAYTRHDPNDPIKVRRDRPAAVALFYKDKTTGKFIRDLTVEEVEEFLRPFGIRCNQD